MLLATSTGTTLSLPRRPQLFHQDNPSNPIDRQRTVSLLARYTLSWATPILRRAQHEKGRLQFKNLAYLDARTSVHNLIAHFHSIAGAGQQQQTRRLWRHIVYAHRWTFARQWTITVFYALAALAPQYVMYQLIRLLERKEDPTTGPGPSFTTSSVWLGFFGLAQLVLPWIETWMLWVGWCHVALPVYAQLAGLVVEKSLKIRDVKSVKKQKKRGGKDKEKEKEEGRRSSSSSSTSSSSSSSSSASGVDSNSSRDGTKKRVDAAADDEAHQSAVRGEEEPTPKTMQDQINLVGVDAQRISDFLSYNGM